MRFKEILKQCVLVAVMFGLAESVQAQAQAREDFVRDSMENYKSYLIRSGLYVSSGSVVNPTDTVAPGSFVKEVVTANVSEEDLLNGSFSGDRVQQLVNNDVIDLITKFLKLITRPVPLTNSYNLNSREAVDGEAGYVIPLYSDSKANGPLRQPVRLVEQLANGDWRRVDNGDGGAVSYYSGFIQDCRGVSWSDTVSGLVPARAVCIRFTVVDGGIYDTDRRLGFISPGTFIGIEENSNIPLAHAGGGGSNTELIAAAATLAAAIVKLVAGSAGAWTIMALLTVLGLSMLRRRRVTVRSEL